MHTDLDPIVIKGLSLKASIERALHFGVKKARCCLRIAKHLDMVVICTDGVALC